jgi:hypothetical protein
LGPKKQLLQTCDGCFVQISDFGQVENSHFWEHVLILKKLKMLRSICPISFMKVVTV